jgi:prepilin-type N-terminal cleavage/methylation domain-containing protein
MSPIARQRGFTLVELALVVGIVALLLGGLLVPLSRSIEQKAIANTQASLEAAQQALIGFALLNGRLPCPDTHALGAEDTPAAGAVQCPSNSVAGGASWGQLPWNTLGVSGVDGWGYRLDYAVHTPLAVTAFSGANIRSSNLVVNCSMLTAVDIPRGFPGCFDATTPGIASTTVSFLVFSHGKNGRGAIRPDGTPNAPPETRDESQNLLTTAGPARTFVSRYQTVVTSDPGEFDDLFVLTPPFLLTAKLLAAGMWPQ